MSKNLVLYAPNVHSGGGFVLLNELLKVWPESMPLTAFLDKRARGHICVPQGARVFWVTANAGSRLKAEFDLRKVAILESTVLCFHGLPPVLPTPAHVVVFQQNRNLLGLNSLGQFVLKTRLRLIFERLISWGFRHRVSEYVVQTPSMHRAVSKWYGANTSSLAPAVRSLPFVNVLPCPIERDGLICSWDFVYVADGEAHKNHRVLAQAWQLLAQDGLHPSLALTLSHRDAVLKRELEALAAEDGLRIKDLGQMTHENVFSLYATAKAMIFPSTSESFGLPLIEARNLGLPILASELDYVRDVCSPVHTFDPTSAVSIARAVKRFLEVPEPILRLRSPEEFWQELLSDRRA